MKTLLKHLSCFCLFFIFGTNYAIAQNYQHDFDQVVKKVDDLLWYEKVGDIAHIDKVYRDERRKRTEVLDLYLHP
mgnify:CR=1 FL=1